ncbi:radical SAM family heme chaperone HemW [Bacillus suaedaesalsae]|uniref:Heme chaperone HemW n=1 Tax=Bacillus suaedaesalsae TaxID=2810349 RepID=A0ABS2DL72_9BACI|nr:radical SAM family heme chaperone HemW [Bacillus suaedaesalsae]MBM6619240.1 oxygen-independent coproporphyrinogen III oxidase [Bacillus suaedaesalsae]
MIQAAYIHIPFCHQICHYCDFNKVFLKGQPVDDYLNYLEREMKNTLVNYPTSKLKTIFIGGGTPTSLNEKQLERLLSLIRFHLPFDVKDVEYTIEANPGDLTIEKLSVLKNGGINRLSVGVQSFNDELLKKIGRTHKADDVIRGIELTKQLGFQNVSIDLIYSLPNQTLQDFKDTLEKAFSLELQHFSAYSLIIEPKTVFYNLMRKGNLPLPSHETEAKMYELLMDEMEVNGYHQYEISNFSKEGYESRHNLTYWDNEDYFGFGAGAHSYVNGSRNANAGPLKKYMSLIDENGIPLVESHPVTDIEKMEEELFLGLRKADGVSLSTFEKKYGKKLLDVFGKQVMENTERGLLTTSEDRVFLTRQGKLLGNEVFQTFLTV